MHHFSVMGKKKTHELLLQTTPPFSHPAPPNFKIITNYPFQIIPSSSSSLFYSTTNDLLLCNHEIPPPTQLWTPRGSSSSSFAFNSTSFLSISLLYVAILFHEGDNRSVIHVQLYNSSEIVNVKVCHLLPFFVKLFDLWITYFGREINGNCNQNRYSRSPNLYLRNDHSRTQIDFPE